MNPHTFLLLSKDPDLKQLLHIASPHAKIIEASTISEGLSLWSAVLPTLVIGEGILLPWYLFWNTLVRSLEPRPYWSLEPPLCQGCSRNHACRRGRLPNQAHSSE